MSLYDTREIGKVKIVMLKGTDGANSYNAGAGINLVGNTFVNAHLVFLFLLYLCRFVSCAAILTILQSSLVSK